MSAAASPYGMVPVLNQGAQYNSQGFGFLPILDGYSTAIYFGDVVKNVGGYLQKDTGTTTLTPCGVFLGCTYVDPSLGYYLNNQFWPASTTTSQTLSTVGYPLGQYSSFPWGVFQIQANGPVSVAQVGLNAAIIQTAGTAAGGGKSRNALSASSIAVTSSLPLRIIGFVQSPTNAPGDAFTDVLVTFNNNQLLFNTTGQ